MVKNNQNQSVSFLTVENLRDELNGEVEYDEDEELPTEEELQEIQELLNVVEANDFSKTGVVLVIEKDQSQKFYTVEIWYQLKLLTSKTLH